MIDGSPYISSFPVEIAIANRCLFELLTQPLCAARRYIVKHRLIDKAAALP